MKKSLITILILLLVMATMPMTVFADSKDDGGDEETGYLTFSSDAEFSLALKASVYAPSVNVEYSTDAETWTTWNGTSVTAVKNNEMYAIYVRGTGNKRFGSVLYHNYFWIDAGNNKVECTGNVETLLDYATVLAGEHPEMESYCFYRLFNKCTALITAPELPATDLSENCYDNMFAGCTSLEEAPELPATNLSEGCYQYMFYNCTSLTEAPVLPATELASGCYGYMFYGCTSLTTAPELPAIELADYCYRGMFYDCTSLTEAPELRATKLTYYCYETMFYGCTSLTEAPELSATELADYCYRGMFEWCTSLENAPKLKATNLADYCYGEMFYGCTSLKAAPELPATNLSEGCYEYMFYNCTSLTEAPVLPATELASSCYRYMFYGCTSLLTAAEIKATNLAEESCAYMFYGCTSLENAPELKATNLAYYCYREMFYGCTSLTKAPELPATTLAVGCYKSMFYGCTSLEEAPELPATTLATNCYEKMFCGCTSLTATPTLPGDGEIHCYTSMFEGCTSLTTLSKLRVSYVEEDECYFDRMYYGCTSIKVSDEQGLDVETSTFYFHEWEILVGEKEYEDDDEWVNSMLTDTGGTFTGEPQANTIYYVPHYGESAEYSSSVKYTWSEDYSSCTATLTCTCGYTNEKECEVTENEEYYIATVAFAELYDADEKTYSDDCTNKVSKSAAADNTTETTTSTVSKSTTGTSDTTETLEEEATDSEATEDTESVTGLFSNATDLASMRAAIATVKLIARSSMSTAQGKQAVKIMWLIEGATYEDFDGYEIFRSTKRYSGYGKKAFFDTTKITYHNTAIKSGSKYYYKVRAYKLVDGEKLYTDWSLKAWRTVK